jgi:hypothetical protein
MQHKLIIIYINSYFFESLKKLGKGIIAFFVIDSVIA